MTTDIVVLHVDDSEPILDLTAELLEKEDSGITVFSEKDPSNVLRAIETTDVDCVVSDYEMPDMDGLALCRRIRHDYPDLPFFVFTSNGKADLVDDAFAAGATDYIQKDPGVAQYKLLANRIRNAVRHHKARRRLDEITDTI